MFRREAEVGTEVAQLLIGEPLMNLVSEFISDTSEPIALVVLLFRNEPERIRRENARKECGDDPLKKIIDHCCRDKRRAPIGFLIQLFKEFVEF